MVLSHEWIQHLSFCASKLHVHCGGSFDFHQTALLNIFELIPTQTCSKVNAKICQMNSINTMLSSLFCQADFIDIKKMFLFLQAATVAAKGQLHQRKTTIFHKQNYARRNKVTTS